MNILFYHPWIKSKGGIERLLLEYSKNSEYEVDIATHYLEESFDEYDEEIKELSDSDLPKTFFDIGLKAAPKILMEKLDFEDYDIFIVSEAGIGSLITPRNHSLPTICYCHTPLRTAHQFYEFYLKKFSLFKRLFFRISVFFYKLIEKFSWNFFDKIIANSKNTANNIVSAKLVNSVDTVIYPGADLSEFYSKESKTYFFYPSRFKEYKRQKLAIKAFKKFNEKYKDYKLILAGFPDDEDYLKDLKEISNENIIIEENISDKRMKELYAKSKAILFTAENEDWGIVPIEAMASGKPVIAVNEGGPTESIIDEETGFLCEDTPKDLSDKMKELVEKETMYTEMCKKAQERAKEFTWKKFSRKLDKEVEKVVK